MSRRFRRHARASLLLFVLCLSGAAPAVADYRAGARFDVALPQGDFSDNADDPGFGIDLHGAFTVAPSAAIGLYVTYLTYGRESRTERLPLVDDFEIVTSNNIFSAGLMSQLKGADGRFIPYVEARFGLLYLWTESKLEDDDWIDDEDIAEKVNYDDFALVYGGGGGFAFRVSRSRGHGNPDVYVDLKVLYMRGSQAKYLTEGDIEIDANDRPVFNASESNTDLLHFQVGVSVTF